MRYRGGDRAVSVVIGAVLLLGIAVTLLALLQTNAVPVWNKEVEFDHNQGVQDDMKDLRSNVQTTASTGSPTSTSIDLGATYPNRIILRNPPPSTGTISTSHRNNITIPESKLYLDNVSVDGATGDYWDGDQKNFSTRAVHYTPRYAQYDTAPSTVLENGVLYNARENASNVSVALSEQNLVDGRRINLVTVNGSLSETQSGKATVEAEPVSAPSQSIAVTDDGNPINITLPTAIPNSTWTDLLESEYASNGGNIASQSYSRGDDRSYLHLKLKQGVTYNLRMAKVGVGSFVEDEDQHYLTVVSGNESTIPQGTSQKLVVEVRDRYNNPVSGALVNASLDSGSGSVTPSEDTTDEGGRADFTYTAPPTSTNAEVVMNISASPEPREEVKFTVNVYSTGSSGGGGSGAYDVFWLDPSGQTGTSSCSDTDCTLDASQSSTLDLTMDTAPTADGANVQYAVNNSTVGTVSPNNGTTNSSGQHTTTFSANANGSVKVYTTSGGSGDTINLTLINVVGGIIYNNDGTAVDVPADGTNDQSGVQFSVTNNENSDVTMTGITVDASGPAAELQEGNSGTGPWNREVFVDASDDGYAEAGGFINPNSYTLGDTITLTDDAVISGNGGTATIYLYEFLNNGGNSVDMSGRTVDVTLHFQSHDPVSFSFTA